MAEREPVSLTDDHFGIRLDRRSDEPDLSATEFRAASSPCANQSPHLGLTVTTWYAAFMPTAASDGT